MTYDDVDQATAGITNALLVAQDLLLSLEGGDLPARRNAQRHIVKIQNRIKGLRLSMKLLVHLAEQDA